MTYKQFKEWCERRAEDGRWSTDIAIMCTGIVRDMDNTSFWKKRQVWKNYEPFVMDRIIIPTNRVMWKESGRGDLPL